MKHDRVRRRLVSSAALTSLLVLGFLASEAQAPLETNGETPFVVYFDDGPFPTTRSIRDDTTFVALTGLVRRMELPYTDATGAETFTIRGPLGTLIAAEEQDTLTVNGRNLRLDSAPFRENGEWFVPVDFLTTALEQITGVDFRHDSGAPRMLAGSVNATALTIAAIGNEGETRLTIRSEVSVNVRVQQIPEEGRVVLAIDRIPMDPAEETLDYRDASIQSIRFDDADGRSKIIVETTPQVASVRLTPTDENRTFFVDFVPESAPAETVAAMPAPDREGLASSADVRVIVIDPGHGGLDSGTEVSGTLEKDLTLTLSRQIRALLQREFDATVILTRDSDLELSGETRSAIANNNQADLLISIHIGFSSDPTESGTSLFSMKEMTGDDNVPEGTLFKPWYRTHQGYLSGSRELAAILQQSLSRAIPGWEFQAREAPLSVLSSAGMPALLIEVGNLNNPSNLLTLTDAGFQARLVEAIVQSVAEFGDVNDGGL